MLQKNWLKIVKEPNRSLRLALLEEDARVVDGLRRGFPEYFSSAAAQISAVDISKLRTLATEMNPSGGNDVSVESVLDAAMIPYLAFSDFKNSLPGWLEEKVPEDVMCIFGWSTDEVDPIIIENGPQRFMVVDFTLDTLVIVPAEYVNTEA